MEKSTRTFVWRLQLMLSKALWSCDMSAVCNNGQKKFFLIFYWKVWEFSGTLGMFLNLLNYGWSQQHIKINVHKSILSNFSRLFLFFVESNQTVRKLCLKLAVITFAGLFSRSIIGLVNKRQNCPNKGWNMRFLMIRFVDSRYRS